MRIQGQEARRGSLRIWPDAWLPWIRFTDDTVKRFTKRTVVAKSGKPLLTRLGFPGQCHNQKHLLWLITCHRVERCGKKRQTEGPLGDNGRQHRGAGLWKAGGRDSFCDHIREGLVPGMHSISIMHPNCKALCCSLSYLTTPMRIIRADKGLVHKMDKEWKINMKLFCNDSKTQL